MNVPFKILFKYPCRGREKLFFESLDTIHSNVADVKNYHVSLTLDLDDPILNTPGIIEKINKYSNTSIAWGYSKSKIDAINRDMPEYDYDILIAWSNDMFWTLFGFDDQLRQYMNYAFPEMDGLFHIPEPDTRDILNTLFICTKKYYDRFGYIYHPSYLSLFCDNESMEVAKLLGKYHYCGIPGFYIHKNPAYHHHKMERDELFNMQQSLWSKDEANFNERKANNFYLSTIKEK